MISIDIDQVLLFHRKIIQETGGSHGIRELSLIESALFKVDATFDGEPLYKGIHKKIAVIVYSLISNHGFVDGNKRIGVAMLILLLRLNE